VSSHKYALDDDEAFFPSSVEIQQRHCQVLKKFLRKDGDRQLEVGSIARENWKWPRNANKCDPRGFAAMRLIICCCLLIQQATVFAGCDQADKNTQ
jgi:hypothetical protein